MLGSLDCTLQLFLISFFGMSSGSCFLPDVRNGVGVGEPSEHSLGVTSSVITEAFSHLPEPTVVREAGLRDLTGRAAF